MNRCVVRKCNNLAMRGFRKCIIHIQGIKQVHEMAQEGEEE